jgi:D-threonate/D-erythronate kinase
VNASEVPITVLADDLTGAAEIAGILRRFGYEPRLFRSPDRRPEQMTCVIDTDSRLLPPDVAANRIADAMHGVATREIVFKKIDSLLRGPVGAEIDAVLDTLRRDTALVLAQNPSRSRCVTRGRYTVDGVALDQTPFRNDPEYPRHTDEVVRYVQSDRREVILRVPGDPIIRGAINIASAASIAEVDGWVGELDQTILPVGAADLLTSFVRGFGLAERADPPVTFDRPRLIVAGSASAYARSLPGIAQSRDVTAIAMHDNNAAWADAVTRTLETRGIALMHVGRDVTADRATAERIQSQIARAVARVVRQTPVADLLVDGGATAAAVIRELGRADLIVSREIAPGVVMLQSAQPPRLTLKPGSYAWPASVFD